MQIDENNEIEEKEQTTDIIRKESENIIPNSKKGNIKVLKIEDLKPKNETRKFFVKEQKKMSNVYKKLKK